MNGVALAQRMRDAQGARPQNLMHCSSVASFADDDVTVDWTLRHGRCVSLGVAIMQDAGGLTSEYGDRVENAALAFSQSDRVRRSL